MTTMQNNTITQSLQNKKVGVVIPIYNVAEYLRECLDSVINQTYKNLSIVLVNDGSTDNNESLNIAKEYVAKDSRFILIDKENGGQSTARNVGIAWFSEKYETKLDSSVDLEFNVTYAIDSATQNKTNQYSNSCYVDRSGISNIDSKQNLDSKTDSNKDILPVIEKQNKQQTLHSNDKAIKLYTYNITNENPYNIYKIYASNINTIQDIESIHNTNSIHTANTRESNKSKLQPQQIDYIIFLDSDDYWKPYTIEECIKHSDGVDIVWFDWEYYFDKIKIKKIEKTYLQHLGFKLGKITPNDLFDTLLNKQLKYFAWVIQGIIDFKFLQKINLYFYDGVFAEDHLFGALLFLQAKSICIIPEPFYIYRIRSNSSCNFDSKYIYVPRHFEKYCDMFGDRLATRKYYEASSWFLMLVELREFIKNHPNSLNDKIEQFCLPYYSENSLRILDLRSDPFDLIAKISEIEPYLKKGFKYRHKLRITNPAKYNRLKPLFNIYDSIKGIERTIRKVFKKEKD